MQPAVGGGDSQSAKLPGLYVGEGLPPVPVKLVEKIHKWEFVDMAEMLPEYWGRVKLESIDISRKCTARGQEKVDSHHELGAMLRRLYQRDGIKQHQSCPGDAGLSCVHFAY